MKSRLYYLLIAIAIGCAEELPKNIIHVYNPTDQGIQIKVDGTSYPVAAGKTERVTLSAGRHKFEYENFADSFDVEKTIKLLINPTKQQIVKSEIIYQKEIERDKKARAENYTLPFNAVVLDSLRYGGYFVITDDVFISRWLFNIGEPISEKMESQKIQGKTVDIFRSSAMKLYSIDEFKKSTTPLNYDREFIGYVINTTGRRVQENDHVFWVNPANSFMTGERMDVSGSIGTITTTNEGLLYFKPKELYKYNKKEHGKIITELFEIPNCIIEHENGKKENGKTVLIVDVEECCMNRMIIK